MPFQSFLHFKESSIMPHLDLVTTTAINALAGRYPLLDALLVQITSYGVPLMIAAVALQWWRRSRRPSVRHVLVASGLSFLLGLAINQAILLFVHRIRPYDAGVTHLLIAPSSDFSFPSDHATASFSIAFAFLLHGLRRWGAAFVMVAVVICFSRIFVGTHYVSDILGGALSAALACVLVRALYQQDTRLDRWVTKIF
jgi:undecaprenyl-diphosphatase